MIEHLHLNIEEVDMVDSEIYNNSEAAFEVDVKLECESCNETLKEAKFHQVIEFDAEECYEHELELDEARASAVLKHSDKDYVTVESTAIVRCVTCNKEVTKVKVEDDMDTGEFSDYN